MHANPEQQTRTPQLYFSFKQQQLAKTSFAKIRGFISAGSGQSLSGSPGSFQLCRES